MTATQTDPLHVLREYRNLAPWNLRDLAGLVGAVLDASAITPINAAARAQPSERTVRFYVTKRLVSPPEGRGTAATYSYRHFLQLLWIKLRQMEGGTLAAITKEMQDQTGDVLERRAAQVLGPSLTSPDRLPLRGRRPVAGRRLQRPRVPQEPDAQRVQTDRRPAQAATRPDPEPRERGEGSDGLRAVHAGGGDPGAQSGGAGERERPGGRQAHQPSRERAVLGVAAADGGGGAVSPTQGHEQRGPAPRGVDVDREPHRLRAPALQRHGDPVQHAPAAVPDVARRGAGPGPARRPVGDHGPGRARRATGRPLAEAQGVTDEPSLTLFQQQEANRRRTTLLVVGFVLFFAWLGFGGDFIYWLATAHEPPAAQHTVWWFGMAATALGALLAWYAYSTGPEKVLWATGAEEVREPATDPQRQLVNVVEEMAIAAGVPRPRIWIVPDPDPNAFATGVDPGHAHVAVTQGLLDLCSRDELQAVIGHELGHVKNLDVRLMTTLAALVGAVLLMRDGATRIFFSRGSGRIAGGGGGGRGGRKNLGPLV